MGSAMMMHGGDRSVDDDPGKVLPGIETSVMPRWLEHVRTSPLRFQNGRIIPLRQSSGICSVNQTWLKMLVSHVTTASPPLFNSFQW